MLTPPPKAKPTNSTERAGFAGSLDTFLIAQVLSDFYGERKMTEKTARGWSNTAFTIQNGNDAPFAITVCGRDGWALECLIRTGDNGCTSIETPGPRWSGYIFDLRELGVDIETINEPHEGPFKGTHARYVLRSHVTPCDPAEIAA